MREGSGAARGFRTGGPLVLAGAGWLCGVPTLLADDDVRALVSRCRDSAGAPVYVLPLAWLGLLSGIGAVCWGGWQLVTARRRSVVRTGLGHLALCAVLPVAVLATPVQYALTRTAVHDTGQQRSSCFG
ncbi:hypothetical protein ACGF12_37480 [Kitasatospora sp. NPDC048296]|uniref:hypothetical protein n=1 Tax=Kitasatospora sp. NPDC048296 TaxID=3364048 RepID=UPI00371073C4